MEVCNVGVFMETVREQDQTAELGILWELGAAVNRIENLDVHEVINSPALETLVDKADHAQANHCYIMKVIEALLNKEKVLCEALLVIVREKVEERQRLLTKGRIEHQRQVVGWWRVTILFTKCSLLRRRPHLSCKYSACDRKLCWTRQKAHKRVCRDKSWLRCRHGKKKMQCFWR